MLFIMRTKVKTSMGYLKYLTWSERKKKNFLTSLCAASRLQSQVIDDF